MSKKEKLLKRLLAKPKDFTYDDLVRLLGYFGFTEFVKGKTSGSRRIFVNAEKYIIRLHKPHPDSILKIYQLKEIIAVLKEKELI